MPASLACSIEAAKFAEKAAGLYRLGYSTYEIAERFGCSQGKVAHALRRANVKMRSFSEAVTLSKHTAAL